MDALETAFPEQSLSVATPLSSGCASINGGELNVSLIGVIIIIMSIPIPTLRSYELFVE